MYVLVCETMHAFHTQMLVIMHLTYIRLSFIQSARVAFIFFCLHFSFNSLLINSNWINEIIPSLPDCSVLIRGARCERIEKAVNPRGGGELSFQCPFYYSVQSTCTRNSPWTLLRSDQSAIIDGF